MQAWHLNMKENRMSSNTHLGNTHLGTLSSFRFADDATDLRGTTLYGVGDEKLGTIDDVIFDHGTGRIQYAVVDTGGWLRHRRFIVPADRIRAYEKHEDD